MKYAEKYGVSRASRKYNKARSYIKGVVIEGGSLDELADRIAPYRQLVIDFYSEQNITHPKAEIIKTEGARTVYRFMKKDVTAAKLIEDIGKQAKIKDIRLEEANIDDIIRGAYGGRTPIKGNC